jgi:hypothetical protein
MFYELIACLCVMKSVLSATFTVLSLHSTVCRSWAVEGRLRTVPTASDCLLFGGVGCG